ncbi:uncharacterized protein [Clytia hemisphaerica]|uniref:uncharacterized protein n=2 Tax=Clytia hemisphaerica TaxID=252671 RepID=UPI0034D58F77
MERWCPTLESQAKLAHKIYLCLLTYQVPYKTKRLVLTGDIDCGKTSVVNLFFGLIPRSKIAIITKEGVFGLQMVRPDTELLFIDEWSKEMASADMVKMLFQGGSFPQSIKYGSPLMQEMNAGVFVTCNHIPKFPRKQRKSVKRRISKVKCRKLEEEIPEAPSWIMENAMHCLTYLINLINNNLNVIEPAELTYTLPTDVKCEKTVPKDDVDEESLERIKNCVVDPDESVPLADQTNDELEVFRVVGEEDMVLEDEPSETHDEGISILTSPDHSVSKDELDVEKLIGYVSSTTDFESDIEPPRKRARGNTIRSPVQMPSTYTVAKTVLYSIVERVVEIEKNDTD